MQTAAHIIDALTYARLEYVRMLTSNKCVQCTAIHIALCIADGACALVLQQALAVYMQTCIAQTHHRWEGTCGCWVGSHIGSHDKCTYMQGIRMYYYVHCLHMYCVCMMDLVIMPKRLVLIATTPVGKVSGWLNFDPREVNWLGWGGASE